jgi:GDP/UDP-N,N'-diacetylbacillosamine 2-epimerase (hydrolysing)
VRVGILTSSRADYGIYKPLLKSLWEDSAFELSIIAFGTHLSRFFGYTVNQIEVDGFPVAHRIESLIHGDSEEAVGTAMGLTTTKFSQVWEQEKHNLDLLFGLGDRYEMFAAVSAAVPFNIPIAHIHGGETTLGAIDNKFRHAITQMADYHFTSTTAYADKVRAMMDDDQNVYNVGALSLDNLQTQKLYSLEEFKEKVGIDLSYPTILITVHPETVNVQNNEAHIQALLAALDEMNYQFLFTMPNADTQGTVIREAIKSFVEQYPQKAVAIENLGTQAYFTAMKHCAFMMGNSSSGIIEAASLGTYVINLGNRQNGRLASHNVQHVSFDKDGIQKAIQEVEKSGSYKGNNIYWNGGAADQIVQALKENLA